MTKSPVKLAGELPKMVVFDLDFTLWDLWCDTHVTPPLARRGDELNRVHDRHGQPLSFYRDVPAILFQLHHSNIHVAAASRTHAPKVARQILSELLLPGSRRDSGRDPLKAHEDGEKKETVSAIKLFDSMEIYPGSKMDHFRELNRKTGIPFNQMLFFDGESMRFQADLPRTSPCPPLTSLPLADESRNREVAKLGVTFVLVGSGGVTRQLFESGLEAWRAGLTSRREL